MTASPPVRYGDGNPVSEERLEAAAAEGRRLAAHSVSGAIAPLPAENPVEGLARAGITRLRDMGVVTEVVRARRGCLVLRTAPRVAGYEAEACTLVQAWLGALPAAVYGGPGTVAESSCGARGGRACMHTLMWQEPAGIRRMPLDPPHEPAPALPGALDRTQSGGAVPVPSSGVAHPHPIPAAYETTPGAPPNSSPPSPLLPGMSLAPLHGQPASNTMPVVAPPLPAVWPLAAPRDPSAAGMQGPTDSSAGRPQSSDLDPDEDDGVPAASSRRVAWLRRRAWLLLIGLLAGCLGGYVASSHGGSSYTATSVLVVQGSGPTAATSSANGAEALSVTYAALIPQDQAMLHRVAAELRLPEASVAHSLAVQAESGTALVEVHFSSSDPTTAVKGSNDVIRLLTSGSPPGRAIAAGSVALVSTADAASKSGTLHKYGLPLGVLGGIAVGAGAALVAERTDRRIDDLDALGSAADCSATIVPGGLTTMELARSLQRTGGNRVTVVPLRAAQSEAANDLAWSVRVTWPAAGHQHGVRGDVPGVLVSPPFADSPESLSDGSGQTMLVVGAGERAAAVREVVERLRLLGRGPTWAVLVSPGETRPDGRAR